MHGEVLKEAGLTPRQIRFQLYRIHTREVHGVLGKEDRRPLPTCVEGAIKIEYFEEGEEHVGFVPAVASSSS